jgi:hypothetical protein
VRQIVDFCFLCGFWICRKFKITFSHEIITKSNNISDRNYGI